MEHYRERIKELCETQRLAVVSTCGDGEPYANLVAFALSPDVRSLYFATTRATHKYRNLSVNPRCALLIDNRENATRDFHEAMAVTAMGCVQELKEDEDAAARTLLVARHAYLDTFVAAPSVACFQVKVERYILVEKFQHVVELDTSRWT